MKTIRIFIISLFLIIFSFSVNAGLSDFEGIAYYKFENNLEDIGSAGNSFDMQDGGNGFSYNNTDSRPSGGNSLVLNMNESQYLENITSLNGTAINKITTIDLWFKPNSTDIYTNIVTIWKDLNDFFTIGQNGNTNIIHARLEIDAVVKFDISSTRKIAPGEWVHIVLVMGSGGARLYVNGTLKATDPDEDVIPTDFTNMLIGADPSKTAGFVDGLIDNIFMTNAYGNGSGYSPTDVNESWNNGAGFNFADIQNPSWKFNRTNFTTISYNENGQFNITVEDEVALDTIILSFKNNTAAWENISTQRISGTSYDARFNMTISLTRNQIQYWKFYVNDTTGHWNETDEFQITVNTTAPTIPSSITPANLSHFSTNYSVINWSSTDVDSDAITYWLENRTRSIYTGAGTGYNYTNLANGDYTFRVIAGDGTKNSSYSDWYNFTIDTDIPLISCLSLDNTTVQFSYIVNPSCIVTDSHLSYVGFEMRDINRTLVAKNITEVDGNTSWTGVRFDLTGNQSGNFTLIVSANDSVSGSPKIPYYSSTITNDVINFADSVSGENIDLTISLLDDNLNEINIIPYIGDSVEMVSDKDSKGEHIEFGIRVDNSANLVKKDYKFKFTYSPNSGNIKLYSSGKWLRFTLGNKYFHHQDLKDNGWKVHSAQMVGENYEVIIFKDEYENQIDVDPITGSINSAFENYLIILDRNNPNVTSLDLPLNNTWTNQDITFQGTCNEINEGYGRIYTNQTNWELNVSTASAYQDNVLFSFPSVSLSDGIYLWNVECNDSADNTDYYDWNYTIKVDKTIPDISNYNVDTTVVVGDVITVYANCSDILSGVSLSTVKFQYKDPTTTYNSTGNAELHGNQYSYNITTSATLGAWNYEYVWCNDIAGNSNRTYVNTDITVSAAAAAENGGGGGGAAPITKLEVLEAVGSICGNGICEEDESPNNCPTDCVFDVVTLLSLKEAWATRWFSYILGIIFAYFYIKRKGKIRK